MARPASEQPTDGELEILGVLWETGPAELRIVHTALCVRRKVATTTVATMRSYAAPGSLPPNNRIQPQETTVYSIDATLTEYKLETDSDYHLVIQDASSNTMITEIPDPACAAGSPFLGAIQTARNQFDAAFSACRRA